MARRKTSIRFQILSVAGTYFVYDDKSKLLSKRRSDGRERSDLQLAEMLLGKKPRSVCRKKSGIIVGVVAAQ